MARIIEVTVSPKGETTLQTKGFAGSDCLQASKELEQALGLSVQDKRTGESFGTEHAQQKLNA